MNATSTLRPAVRADCPGILAIYNDAVQDIHGFQYEDFELVGYDPHPAIKAPVAV